LISISLLPGLQCMTGPFSTWTTLETRTQRIRAQFSFSSL
jgi:hypothetical protein